MEKLADGLILYHGSYCEVSRPLLDKCSRRKDFGKGFYLTTSREQAISFLRTSLIKAETSGLIESGQDYGIISSFEVQLTCNLNSYFFRTADAEWLHWSAASGKIAGSVLF